MTAAFLEEAWEEQGRKRRMKDNEDTCRYIKETKRTAVKHTMRKDSSIKYMYSTRTTHKIKARVPQNTST